MNKTSRYDSVYITELFSNNGKYLNIQFFDQKFKKLFFKIFLESR